MTTDTNTPSIYEHWMLEPDCPDLRTYVLANSRLIGTKLPQDDICDELLYPIKGARHLDILACHAVGPHVDTWHPEWTVLWVVQHGVDHVMNIADVRSKNVHKNPRMPAKKKTHTVPLRVGQIVLFNAHRVHWVPPVEDETKLIVVAVSFDQRPTREEAVVRLRAANRAVKRVAADV